MSKTDALYEYLKRIPNSQEFIKQILPAKQNLKSAAMTRKQVAEQMMAYCRELIAEKGECEKCHRHNMLTIDHIIPIHILESFGIDVQHNFIKENLRVLCRPCNSFKSNKLDFSTPRTKELLLKFLEIV